MTYSRVTITLKGFTWSHILSDAETCAKFWESKGATTNIEPLETKSPLRSSIESILKRIRRK